MAIILKNTRYDRFDGTYYPDVIGRRSSERLYSVRRVRSPNGKMLSEKQPHSFMVPAKGQMTVHEAALHLPQVKAALKSGWLVREAVPVAAPPSAAARSGASRKAPASRDVIASSSER